MTETTDPTGKTDPSSADEGLNPMQMEAVTAPRCNMIIHAGAGSGKTRVLVARIAYLIRVEGLRPGEIMAVTFTNKAATEMKERIAASVGSRIHIGGLLMGTFHGLCNRILRQFHDAAGLPAGFTIMDEADRESLIRRLVRDAAAEEGSPLDLGGPAEVRSFVREAAEFIAKMKEQGRRWQACADDIMPELAEGSKRRRTAGMLLEIYRRYEETCQRLAMVDFAELILRVCELLEQCEEVRFRLHRLIREILVDEFQDSNDIQLRLIMDLMTPDTHVTAVGDNDQSIYSWRGARPECMLSLRDMVPDVRVVKLEQNYRSTSHILNVANDLISLNPRREVKELWTDRKGGEPVTILSSVSATEEAALTVRIIRTLHQEEQIPYSQMAVLYRFNSISRNFENELTSQGIPYRILAGRRFFDRQEIRDLMGYLRLLVNPEDDAAFLRVVNMPPRGVGKRSLEVLEALSRSRGIGMLAAAGAALEEKLVAGRARSGLAALLDLLPKLREDAAGEALENVVRNVMELSGLYACYQEQESREKYDDGSRTGNLEEFVNSCALFPFPDDEERDGLPALALFLQQASLETESAEESEEDGGDRVNLLTIHAAKGLEFDTVFLVAFEEGILPSARAFSLQEGSADAQDEELRLAYVAVTRARNRCYLSYARSRVLFGQVTPTTSSSFMRYLSGESVRTLSSDSSLFPRSRKGLRSMPGTSAAGGSTGSVGKAGSSSAGKPGSISSSGKTENAGSAGKAGSTVCTGKTGSAGTESAGTPPGAPEVAPETPKPRMVTLGGAGGAGNKAAATPDFRPGDRVFHQKFGEGTVRRLQTGGAFSRIWVEFAGKKMMCLSLQMANLRKLPGGERKK